MLAEVEKFVDKVRNYKVVRRPDDMNEYDIMRRWYKERIDACYNFLKYLSFRKDSLELTTERKAIEDLQSEIFKSYKKWKENYDKKTT